MATPKRKVSHAATASRKAQWLGSLKSPSTTTCPHCGEAIMTYRACPACGYYRGRKAVNITEEQE
jgi:large subunit ribosomal protein L32